MVSWLKKKIHNWLLELHQIQPTKFAATHQRGKIIARRRDGTPVYQWRRLPAWWDWGKRYDGASLRRLRAKRGLGRPSHART